MSKTYNLVGGGNVEKSVLVVTVTNGTPTSVTATNGSKTVNLTRQGILPDGYTQLEYLESSGTQYINTGFKMSSGGKTETKAMYIAFSSGQCTVFGCQNAASPWNVCFLRTSGADGTLQFYVTEVRIGQSPTVYISTNTVYEATAEYDATTSTSRLSFRHALEDTVATGTNTTSPADYPLFLFACNTAGSVEHQSTARIYYFNAYNASGEPARRMYPARRNSDSVLGMYDTVNNTFYTNAGTGTFIAGPELSWTGNVTTGTWTVTATDGTNSGSVSVTVDTVRVYSLVVGMSELGGDYTKLEYVDGSSLNYASIIFSSFYPVGDNRMIDEFQMLTTPSANAAFIYYYSDSPNINAYCRFQASNSNFAYGPNNSPVNFGSADYQKHTVNFRNKVCTFDGTSYTSSGTPVSSNSTAILRLVFANTNGFQCRHYELKVYDTADTTLIYNLVPAKRNSDSFVGMFDIITGTFFNAVDSPNDGNPISLVAGPAV